MRLFPNRTIESGDPRPWQFWRWMDITGPSDHPNAEHEDLYLRRLYILRTPWFGVMLHWIKREDWDRDALHDHPWVFYRWVLSGGYTEQLAYASSSTELGPEQTLTHKVGRFSRFPDKAFHRISSVKPRTVTLVLNGAKTNDWGFFVPGTGKVRWQDYVNGAR